ncbi:MAG: hypothetical protein HZB38_07965 [Planctomycetes bacterium]|nr:hypothetical protein [Planctomycetota bacterium]
MTQREITETLRGLPPRGAPEWRLALDSRLVRSPRSGLLRYLLGCECFDQARPATAVRQMMIAHHAEPMLESAALLVFAGLNCVSRSGVLLLPALLEAWEEFRRPEFDRNRAERAVLDAFAEPLAGLQGSSSLARRLWRLPIRTLRTQIRTAVASHDVQQYPLLLSPA